MNDWEFYILIILMLFVAFMFNAGCNGASLFQRLSSYTTFAKVSDKELHEFYDDMGRDGYLFATIIHLQTYMNKNLKYRPDNIADFSRSPNVTLLMGEGDCDDYAFLAVSCLNYLGYKQAVMVSVFNDKGAGHSYCYCDGYNLGNWGFFKFESIVKSNNHYIADWTHYIVRDEHLNIVEEHKK